MNKLMKDLTGHRFGRLVVIKFDRFQVPASGNRTPMWECRCDCGNIKSIARTSLTGGQTFSCGCQKRESVSRASRLRVGSLSSRWKGGKTKTDRGYIRMNEKKYERMLEHQVVMEKHIGRKLLPEETIHHKNGIRDDNRIDNLELWTSRHPPGQRVDDLVAFALEILQQYKLESL